MLISYRETRPQVAGSAFIAPTAVLVGDVHLGAQASVWFNVVIRGDVNFIRIGDRTNIQDGSIIHVTGGTHPTQVGTEVTVGHNVTLHGCTVGDRCLIGMGAVILDGADIGEESMVAAGSLVPPGTVIPPRSLAMGTPARVKRPLSEEEIHHLRESAENYVQLMKTYHTGEFVED